MCFLFLPLRYVYTCVSVLMFFFCTYLKPIQLRKNSGYNRWRSAVAGAAVLDHPEAHYWGCVPPSHSQKTCRLHIRHRPFCGCSAKWKQSFQNMLSLVGFYKRKWLKTTYTHTPAFMYRKTSLTIGCCVSVDSERNLSWKDFYGKCFLKFS